MLPIREKNRIWVIIIHPCYSIIQNVSTQVTYLYLTLCGRISRFTYQKQRQSPKIRLSFLYVLLDVFNTFPACIPYILALFKLDLTDPTLYVGGLRNFLRFFPPHIVSRQHDRANDSHPNSELVAMNIRVIISACVIRRGDKRSAK